MIYLELFWSFFQVGLFSIGGGYAHYAFDSKPSRGHSPVADDDRLCGHYYGLPK